MKNFLGLLKAKAVRLLNLYMTVITDSPNLSRQLLQDASSAVLDSEEIKNAMGYADVTADDINIRLMDNLSDITMAALASVDWIFTAETKASYNQLKVKIKDVLISEGTAEEPASDHPLVGDGRIITTFFPSIGEFLQTLKGDTTNLILEAIIACAAIFVFPGIILGILIGIAALPTWWIICSIVALFFIQLAAQANGRYEFDPAMLDKVGRTAVAPFVRTIINNSLRQKNIQETFHVTTAPGLADLSDPDQLVHTSSMKSLNELTETMTHGSLGISGSRGVGKTTILRAFCEGTFRTRDVPELPVLVSAPVDYDGREFILHLFARLCEEVIPPTPRPRIARARIRRAMQGLSIIAVLSSFALFHIGHNLTLTKSNVSFLERFVFTILIAVFTLWSSPFIFVRLFDWFKKNNVVYPRQVSVAITTAYLIVAIIVCKDIYFSTFSINLGSLAVTADSQRQHWWAIAAGIAALLCFMLTPARAPKPKVTTKNRDYIFDSARDNLDRIRFIQKITTEHTASAGWSTNLQLSGKRAREISERDLTMPRIVSDYRKFASEVAAWWKDEHGGNGRVIIGIDEVDKIRDVEAAEHFLNEIKAIFGTPDCLYLISVSNEALAKFERRSAGFRSAFDSVFDDVITVEDLKLNDAREILLHRIAGISDTFIALCYSLSGALPRDVLRAARTLIEARRHGHTTLDEILRFVLQREIERATNRALFERTRSGQEHASLSFISMLNEDWSQLSPDQLFATAGQIFTENISSLYVSIYFIGTISEIFTELVNRVPPSLLFADARYQRGVYTLARAHGLLYSDSRLALELTKISRANLGLNARD